MIDLARVNYRADNGEATLSVTHDGLTVSTPIDRRRIAILLESIAEALKKMEDPA